jgi:hypothetical protein
MTNDKIERIKKILTDWNPAKDSQFENTDINNYDTEVNDLIFNLEIEFDIPERKVTMKQTLKMIKEVLNEAFNLHLTDFDCEPHAIGIMKILNESE